MEESCNHLLHQVKRIVGVSKDFQPCFLKNTYTKGK